MGPAILKQNSSALRSSKARSVSVEFLVISLINIKSQIKDACLTLPHAKTVHLLLETHASVYAIGSSLSRKNWTIAYFSQILLQCGWNHSAAE